MEQSHTLRPRLGLVCLVAVTFSVGACASGFGSASDRSTPGPASPDARATVPYSTGSGPAGSSPAADAVAPPAPNPAAVPGADRFGVTGSEDFCTAATKVSTALVGLFDSVYAGQGRELQDQVESTLIAIDVLRSVAPAEPMGDLDASRVFLSRFRDVLAESGWSLEAAAQGHPDFFAGAEPDAGFAALTAVVQDVSTRCGVTP